MAFSFEGKVAVITGGAQGIGKQIANDFLKSKAKVIILDVNPDALSSVKDKFSSQGGVDTFQTDVTDLDQTQGIMDKIIDKYSKIDILINNAGITKDNLVLRMKESDWDAVLSVNLKGTFNCSKAVLKYMLKNHAGKIVNISSVIALRGNPGQSNYGASKAGIIGLTKSLAREVASRQINVNAVAPGYIKTAMTDRLSEHAKKYMLDLIPMTRFGDVTDVSNTVMFLASDYSSYITGKVITVDGGIL